MHEETDKSDFQAKKIERVAWCTDGIQCIIPNITYLTELEHYKNEVKEDRWKFYIGINGREREIIYTTKKMAYRKYNELIDKITDYYKKKTK